MVNSDNATFLSTPKSAPWGKYHAMTRLLTVFAQHLSILGQPLMSQQENADVPLIQRARTYIQEHHREKLRLARVARACGTSMYYFGKRFTAEMGLHFTRYLAVVRVEEARMLLLNPNLRMDDIASEAGFKSVKHFSRVFKRIVGQPPDAYRARCIRALIGGAPSSKQQAVID